MFWIFRIFGRRKVVRRIILGIALTIVGSFLISIYILFTRYQHISMFLLKHQVNRVLKDAEEAAEQKMDSRKKQPIAVDIDDKYKDPAQPGAQDGVRGNGVNLLLVDRIQSEGYIKEMLQLYRDSSEGKYDDFQYRIRFESLLGKQYNETEYYDGSNILKSYIPHANGTPQWGKPYGKAPGESMKLKLFNSKVADLAGINSYFNGVRDSGSSYVNVFQIHISYFEKGSVPKSKLNGYSVDSGRKVDMYFLPDSLAYLNQQYTNMMNTFDISDEDEDVLAALYGLWHNGGSGSAEYFNALGTTNYGGYLKYWPSGGYRNASDKQKAAADWKRWLTALPKTLKTQSAKYPVDAFKGVQKGYGVAVWLLLNDGYYIDPNLISKINSMKDSSRIYMYEQLAKGYSAVYGKKVSGSEVPALLAPKVKEVWQAYPNYITESQFNSVYGSTSTAIKKGVLWKLEDETTDAYTHKVNGKNPRVLHRTNIEMAGFAYDVGYRGPQVYQAMLQQAGVYEDVTAPQQYYKDKKNEYIPPSGNFAQTLDKIGAKIDNPKVYAMLEEGFRVSGYWYRFGGNGQLVNQKNWEEIASMSAANSKSKSAHDRSLVEKVYQTKDGSNPGSSPKNRRDDNLVGLNQRVFDCSGFVRWAYNQTIGKATGKVLERNSGAQLYSRLLQTIGNRSEAKPGDIYVKDGHVFFYLAKANGVSVTPAESKVETTFVAKGSMVWTLEAYQTGTRVGIRARSVGSSFVLRRFKDFM